MKKRQCKHKSKRLERRLAKKYPNKKLKDILDGGSKHAGGTTKPKKWWRKLIKEKKRQKLARRKHR